MIFIVLTIKGFKWAKWVLTVLLILFGTLILLAGIGLPSLNLKIVGLYYLLFGLLPHLSKRLKPITNRNNQEKDTVIEALDEADSPSLANERKYRFPYLVDRYKAMLIDVMLMLAFITICVQINSKLALDSTWILVLSLVLGCSYEPLLTTYYSTIGQKIMKIRVRRIDNPNKPINLVQAYLRIITKISLGWLSFITISFDKEKRAIHDMVASSVVIEL